MIFRNRRQLPKDNAVKLKMNGTVVERVSQFKYLGIILDEGLTFSKHIDYLKGLTTQKNEILKRARQYIEQDTSSMLYKAIILSKLDYADVCYDSLLAHPSELL